MERKEVIRQCQRNGSLFYTNSSECVNKKLKTFLGKETLGLTELLEHLPLFFEHETGKAVEAYIGTSQKYKVLDKYGPKFCVGDFNSLSVEVKETLLTSFHTITLDQLDSIETDEFSYDFSISANDVHVNVPPQIVKNMYQKAARLLNADTQPIMMAPSRDKSYTAFSCTSETSEINHQITIHALDGRVVCNCKAYRIYKICSHSIAVAEKNGKLYPYILWHRKKVTTKPKDNQCPLPIEVLTQSVNTSRSGLKDHQKVRKRKSTSSVSGPPPAKSLALHSTCAADHDQDGLVRFVSLDKHKRVTTCSKCFKKDLNDPKNGKVALSMKIHRTYRVGETLKVSFHKEWAYYHLTKRCLNVDNVHVCIDEFQNVAEAEEKLRQHGYSPL